ALVGAFGDGLSRYRDEHGRSRRKQTRRRNPVPRPDGAPRLGRVDDPVGEVARHARREVELPQKAADELETLEPGAVRGERRQARLELAIRLRVEPSIDR